MSEAYDTPVLVVENVSVSFGAVVALREVSFRVEPGTIHSVIGPNGAGKSTLLNVLSGVYRPSSGSVKLGGEELVGRRPYKVAQLGVARAFQNIALSNAEPVGENIMIGRYVLQRAGFVSAGFAVPRARKEERIHRERVAEIADFLDLGSLIDTPVGELSYGGRKRVEIARALAMEPRILLLDEPVAGMNSGEKRYIGALIRRICTSLGVTVVLVEHDMEMVMSLSDHVTVIDFGNRIADGDPATVQADAAVIAAYLGTDVEETT